MLRRQFLAGAAVTALPRPDDEDFWREIQSAFTLDRTMINLNNGGVSPSPRVVQDAMKRYLEYSNISPTFTMWRQVEPGVENVRKRLAEDFGCDPEEIAITRNASEALETVQLGLPLKAGDEVITTEHDYPRMISCWKQRVLRDGIKLKMVPVPAAPSPDALVEIFERAITPRTRVIHFCHITNVTGLIFPVKRICQMARARGIETIVDGAHAYAQFPFKHSDLDCVVYGTSLHKWMLAPHGTGFLYVRKKRIADIWPLMAADVELRNDIRKFEQFGTHPAANHNAIAEAMVFHDGIGVARKAARLRYLRDMWFDRVGKLKGVQILTSRDPQLSCGIGLFRVEGMEPAKIAGKLWEERRIVVTQFDVVKGVRVTPNVYTTVNEIDVFCRTMEKILA